MLTEKMVQLSRKKPLFPAFVFGVLIIMPLIVLLIFAKPQSEPDSALEKESIVPHDIIVFTFDTLRSDVLGCYGSISARTPTFDKFSRKSALFSSAFTDAPETVPAHATLLTGRLAFQHFCLDNRYSLPQTEETLAEILSGAGYQTVAVTNALLKLGRGLEQGFQKFNGQDPQVLDPKQATGAWGFQPKRLDADQDAQEDPLRAEITAKRIVSENVFQDSRPLFLWAHFWDTHLPYSPPELFWKIRGISEMTYPLILFPQNRRRHHEQKIPLPDETISLIHQLYEGEVAYLDWQLGKLLAALGKDSRLQRALIVFCADHGESLFEHDFYIGHSASIRNTVISIPLIIYGPEWPSSIVSRATSIADLFPTLIQYCHLESSRELSGESLLPLLTGEGKDFVHEKKRFVVTHGNTVSKTVLQNIDQKGILVDGDDDFLCFDKTVDPQEETVLNSSDCSFVQKNTLIQLGKLYARARKTEATENIRELMTKEPELVKMLEELGYIDTEKQDPQERAPKFKKQGKHLPNPK